MPQVIVQEFFCDKCGSPLSASAELVDSERQRFRVQRCDYCFTKGYSAIEHAVVLVAALVKRGRSVEEIDDAVSECFHRPEPPAKDKEDDRA